MQRPPPRRPSPLDRLHRAVDGAALWLEARRATPGGAWRPADPAPLACFGPLGALPAPPDRPGPVALPCPVGGPPIGLVVAPAEGRPRGVVVLAPPWRLGGPRLGSGWAWLLREAGFEVWLAPAAEPGPPTADLALLRAAVERRVVQLRVLSALAATRGGTQALVGLSLGAVAAALASTTPEAPPSLALVAPPLDLGALLTRTRLGRRLARLAAERGVPLPDAAALAAALAPFDPGRRPTAARRVFLAAGRLDAVATRRGHLPAVHGWGVVPRSYERGHLTLLLACRQVRADLLAFLGVVPPD